MSMADYESFKSKQCTADDFNRLTQLLKVAMKTRGVDITASSVKPGDKMLASQGNYYRNSANNLLNYSTFIEEIKAGMLIKHEHIECISQAISDINNLLRCRSGCTGNCHTSCSGSCVTGCAGGSQHNGSCSYATWWCSGDCNSSCSGSCGGSCSGSCGNGCNNLCVASCKNSSMNATNRLSGTWVTVS